MQEIKKSDLVRKLSQKNRLIFIKSSIVLKETKVEIEAEK
jgi:hypothetical protein